MCRNWKFWVALATVAVGVVIFTPVTLTALAPFLFIAACPLMMLVGGGMLYRGARTANRHRDVGHRGTEIRQADETGWGEAVNGPVIEQRDEEREPAR